MLARKFGTEIENIVKQKSTNHIVLKCRSFSFDGKNRVPVNLNSGKNPSIREIGMKDIAVRLIKQSDKQNIGLRDINNDPKGKVHIKINKTMIEQPIQQITIKKKQQKQDILHCIKQNPQLVSDYLPECVSYIKSQQKKYQNIFGTAKLSQTSDQTAFYLYLQNRAIIINFLVLLHQQLKLFHQTLFVAIRFMDMYHANCVKDQYQGGIDDNNQRSNEQQLNRLWLISIACIFIASKYQETYQIPSFQYLQKKIQILIQQHVFCLPLSFKNLLRSDLLEIQHEILSQLNFNLSPPVSYPILHLLSHLAPALTPSSIVPSCSALMVPPQSSCSSNNKNFHICHYILELSLLDAKFLAMAPSLIASATVYLVNKIRKVTPAWPQQIENIIGYSEKDLKQTAKALCAMLQAVDIGKQTDKKVGVIKNKFAGKYFMGAANIRLQRKSD